MNPRQRRGILLLLATAIGAVLVFLAVAAYTRAVASEVGPMTTVLRLSAPVTELEPVTGEMVEEVEVPQRWVSASAISSTDELDGMVAAGNFDTGVTLQEGMLRRPPGLQPGYREVAIMVDAETGVAGKIAPGSRVDIIATTVDPTTEVQRSEVWVGNALIIEVGVPTAVEGEDAAGNFVENDALPVTFALASDDALRLAYAESFAVKIRLALRGAGDLEQLPAEDGLYEQGMPVQSGSLPAGVVPSGAASPAPVPVPEQPAPEQPAEPAPEQPAPEQPAEPAPEQPAPEQPAQPEQPAEPAPTEGGEQ